MPRTGEVSLSVNPYLGVRDPRTMALTDKIIIDVDAETARLWREAGDQERLRLMLKLQMGLLSKASG